MAAANPLPPDLHGVRIVDDREAVAKIAHRAEELAARGLRGKDFLVGFGIGEEEPSVTIATEEDLDAFFASDNGCVPSS